MVQMSLASSKINKTNYNEKLGRYESITFNIREVISTAVYELVGIFRLYCARQE